MTEPEFPVGRVAALAQRLGFTEGQVYTVAIGLVVGLVPAAISLSALDPSVTQIAAPPAVVPFDAAPSTPSATATTVEVADPSPISLPPPTSPPSTSPSTVSPTTAPTTTPTPTTTRTTAVATRRPGPVGVARRFAALDGVPTAVATDVDGTVLVAFGDDDAGPRVRRFSAVGDVVATTAIPGRSGAVGGLAVDGAGFVHLSMVDTGEVLRLDPRDGAVEVLAELPDLEVCSLVSGGVCEPGLIDHAPRPMGVAFDARGRLLVADAGQATVWAVDRVGVVTQRASDDRWASSDGVEGPTGVAVDGADNAVVSVGSSVTAFGEGGVFLAAADDGTVTQLATFSADEDASGVALDRSGAIYVALAGDDAIVVLDGQGAETGRLPASGVEMVSPTGLAFSGTELLVAGQIQHPDPAQNTLAVIVINTGVSGAPVYRPLG